MSWHTSAIFIHGVVSLPPEQCFSQLGLLNARLVGPVTFDDAASLNLEGRAYALVRGWHVIFDPTMFFELASDAQENSTSIWPRALELAFSANRWDVMSFLLEGSSGTYGFARYAHGKNIRCVLIQGDTPVINTGEPLREERMALEKFPNDGEQAVLALTERVVMDFHELARAQFFLYSFAEGGN